MGDTLKSALVILFLAATAYAVAGKSVCMTTMTAADHLRRRNLWFAITIAVFAANNFWVYILAVGVLLALAARNERNPLALYFFVLFAVPLINKEIAGFGSIQTLFAIDYARLLAILVLLPAFFRLRRQASPAQSAVDKFLLAFMLLQFLLIAKDSSPTHAIRVGILYPFLGVFLPYYVASRSLRTLEGFREAMAAYVVASIMLGAIGFFEFARHWLLYHGLQQSLGADWRMGNYLVREGNVRASASTGQPIALGYALAIAIGFHLYLRPLMQNRRAWTLGMAFLVAGLIATISRGPWIGAAVVLLIFLMTSPNATQQVIKAAGMGVLLLPMVGDKLIAYLPWIGNVERGNVDFRGSLLEKTFVILKRNPFLGDRNFVTNAEELQDLALGSGFIDIVSTYVRVTLSYGLVGMSLFAACFLTVIAGVYKTMRRIRETDSEGYRLGQVLLSVLISIVVMIGTVSSISVIPLIYWSAIGMGVGYIAMIRRSARQQTPDAISGIPKTGTQGTENTLSR